MLGSRTLQPSGLGLGPLADLVHIFGQASTFTVTVKGSVPRIVSMGI